MSLCHKVQHPIITMRIVMDFLYEKETAPDKLDMLQTMNSAIVVACGNI